MADLQLIAIAPLLLFVGLCGLCENTATEQQPGGIYEPAENYTLVECNSTDCLEEAFEECSPAEENIEQNGTIMHVEIRGESDVEDCIVYMRLDKLNPDLVPPEMSFLIGNIEGSDMVCALTPEEADSALAGTMDEAVLEKCEGPLKGYIQLALQSG